MTEFTVLTINILDDLSHWNARREVLLNQINALEPELIALQEVAVYKGENTAQWLADQLNGGDEPPDPPYELHLIPDNGAKSRTGAIAVLSRWPIKRNERLVFEDQNHSVQLVRVRVDETAIILVNVLYYHQEEEEAVLRPDSIEKLLDKLDQQSVAIPVLICGDFGTTPSSPSIQTMRKYFDSAHKQIHGHEPEYTYPTPLPLSWQVKFVDWLESTLGNHNDNGADAAGTVAAVNGDEDLRVTLDYIFADPRLQILDCQIVCDQPSPQDEKIYPSDHFGLFAELEAVK
ncbi:MAG: endonuclease/exonuclease/phosphatase family protein [Chloroflexota bacterium]|nr:endonuclease/exonuclease/phosphatase family protein [Chloroflexota bacterium]